MNIIKKFKTKKYVYDWGTIYDPITEEKMQFKSKGVFCKTSWAWITTYQQNEESIPEVIRIIFVDESNE